MASLQYVLGLVGFFAEIAVVVCVCSRRNFSANLPLGFYMFCAAIQTAAICLCASTFGTTSALYLYIYYYSDSALMIVMYWVIIRFYLQVFEQMGVGRHIRAAASFLLLSTAVFSSAVVHYNRDHLTTKFVIEFGQNLYFIGVVLIYLLWGAVIRLRETHTRLAQFVLALGIYFSATAATYALRNLFPGLQANTLLIWIPPTMGLWLPVAWTYTLVTVPNEGRIAPALLEAKAAA